MSLRLTPALQLSGILGISLLASSCEKVPKATTDEMKRLRTEIANLQADAKLARNDREGLAAENQALKAGLLQLEVLRERAENAEKEETALRKELAALNAQSKSRAAETAVAPAPAATPALASASGSAPAPAPAIPGTPAAAAETTPAPDFPYTAKLPTTDNVVANRVMSSVVIIKGDKSEGSGFFALDGDTVYLYTAAHVLSGNSKLEVRTHDGHSYTRFGKFETAEGADMVRLTILDPVENAATLLGNGKCAIGDPVFAIGNSGGGGVLTVLDGTVKGLGAGEVEVDAAVIQGNSGGPVFTATDGKVIGVVTHLMAARKDVWAAATPFSDVRRFAARLDGNVRWKPTVIRTFLDEPRQIEEINRGTRLLIAMSCLSPTSRGLRLTGKAPEGVDVFAILKESQDVPAVRSLLEMNSKLAGNAMKQSDADLIKRYTAFYDSILTNAKRQSATFRPDNFPGYHHEAATQALAWRTAAEDVVSQNLNGLSR